jgi:hypothetical protein
MFLDCKISLFGQDLAAKHHFTHFLAQVYVNLAQSTWSRCRLKEYLCSACTKYLAMSLKGHHLKRIAENPTKKQFNLFFRRQQKSTCPHLT